MNDEQRQHLEDQLLLRTTSELSPEQITALDGALDEDTEAAAFTNFLERDLTLATRAPRDFAAEAIAATHDVHAPRDFAAQAIANAMPKRKTTPRLQTMAAAAAVLILFALTVQLTRQHNPIVAVANAPRITVALSERLVDLEAEITTARSRLSHSRYAIPTTL